MTVSVVHVFYEINMALNHTSLMEIMTFNTKKEKLGKGEIAIFMNAGWTACKLLTTQSLLYYRSRKGIVSVEAIRYLPVAYGGPRLIFSKNLEANLIKAFEAQNKPVADLKVAFA